MLRKLVRFDAIVKKAKRLIEINYFFLLFAYCLFTSAHLARFLVPKTALSYLL